VAREPDEIDRYIAEAPESRQAALDALRSACREELGGFRESIGYGMPSYSRAGEIEVAFANQERYISLYILRTDVIAAHRPQLEHLSVGKGAIRYRKPDDIDFTLVRSLLSQTASSSGPIC
jgi:uncharacterized protein YdhG (YjbR/CyaY superfamily)